MNLPEDRTIQTAMTKNGCGSRSGAASLRVIRREPHATRTSGRELQFVAKLEPKDANAAELFGNMRHLNELTVVADPRDLQPYFVELVKAVEIQAAGGPNEAAGRTRRVDIRTARYTYPR